ncbi:MAG TPA: cytochrome c/FTR1 family iron permease [Gammaproteobacteria bacterium]
MLAHSRLLALLASVLLPIAAASADPARLAQLVDYVGVDYPEAVQNGEVVSDLEYAEMQEFSALIQQEIAALPAGPSRDALQPLARELEEAIAAKADPPVVARLAGEMGSILLTSTSVTAAPAQTPDLAAAPELYAMWCAHCHGETGAGDGPAGQGLEPAPTDFTDPARARDRSLYGLYNTITLGVEGTGMTPFPQLTAEQRWALAFYVGGMHVDAETRARGEQAYRERQNGLLPSLRDVTTSRLSEVAARQGEPEASLLAWLRLHPDALAQARRDPLSVAMDGVRRSVEAYAAGDTAAAADLAVDAYLEGFELAEAALNTTRPDLVIDVENAMTALRTAIRRGEPVDQVRIAGERALSLLQDARDLRSEESLSPGVAFTSALVILLREGLEAILVIGAMAAFLGQTGRRDALRWLHGGWLAALGVGVLTWAVSNYLIEISGATRELTEGITALIAAAVLFYVGFWMHSKLNARRWQTFIQSSVRAALNRRSLWAIAGIAFIAAYREVFETVLFFQALWVQSSAPSVSRAIVAGFVVAAVSIVAIAWLVFRLGVRLPLRQFFGVSAAIMIALAVIFVGKGVAALQEAGTLPIDRVTFPRIDVLGIYPSWQTLLAQAIVLAVALALVFRNTRATT